MAALGISTQSCWSGWREDSPYNPLPETTATPLPLFGTDGIIVEGATEDRSRLCNFTTLFLARRTQRLAAPGKQRIFIGMSTTMEAVYQDGKLVLQHPLPLAPNSKVRVTVNTELEADSTREEWLRASEEGLTKTWDNSKDDIFNELLSQ
jgi:hypothetical protein